MQYQENIRNILKQLGVDPELLRWQHLASCAGMDVDYFFDDYESTKARQIDEVCAGCPVIKECFRRGTETKEMGVWGGFYLDGGQVSKKKNSHKTEAMVKKLSGRIYDDVL